MKVNPKKCKSQGKAIGFDSCGKLTLKRTYGLCKLCYIDWLLKTTAGQKHLENSKIKGKQLTKKQREKKEKAHLRALREEVTDYKKLLQKRVNEIARLIDKGLLCLATEKQMTRINGGHVYSRGSQQSMRYNLHNIHRQSGQSNHYQSDDLKMREGIIREYGQGYADFLESCKSTPALKFNKNQYAAFYQIACKIANELKKKDECYSVKERIQLRNKINVKIGVYHLKHCIYGTNR